MKSTTSKFKDAAYYVSTSKLSFFLFPFSATKLAVPAYVVQSCVKHYSSKVEVVDDKVQ